MESLKIPFIYLQIVLHSYHGMNVIETSALMAVFVMTLAQAHSANVGMRHLLDFAVREIHEVSYESVDVKFKLTLSSLWDCIIKL